MNQVKKNFIYNSLYQLLIIILPLITVPYVSRVLGTDGVGIYSYTYSIVYYFMLISLLGINNYGNRSIAKARDDKIKLSKTFFGIYIIQLIMSIIMITCYLVYIFVFDNEFKTVALIQTLYLVSCLLDINWFFFGMEKFKVTITRNMIVKVLSLFLIFMLVKNQNDIWIYTLILSGSTLLSQVILIPFLAKEVELVQISREDIVKHIKPCLVLFIPVIAISLYKILDKIMLGVLSNVSEVGLYEQAEKITSIPISLITALGTVMLPKISNLVEKGKKEEIKKYIKKSISFMMFLAFPVFFGLICVSSDFVPIFLGEQFTKSSILIYYLSSIVLFLSFANVIRTQYLLPFEKDKIYIVSVIGGACINILINYLLIPKYQSIGACIGTLLSEFIVMFIQTIAVKRDLPIIEYIRDIIPFFIKSFIMFIALMLINSLVDNNLVRVIVDVIFGTLIYFILNIKYIFSIIDLKKIFKRYFKNNIIITRR